uniref:EF-hand domain-containing protein n=2 Tax=Corethron hystrix TaxID=216773 RepID=A0A7S1C2A0_9STRA|mmetsp:Transcript_8405/g.18436  ORF Transcript_8405/g.18436 Transcript_8405/m.18436 type:complete len:388 (+) Transcript_8405:353-1516(+)|eukprot:CAMPEP_0113320650 /NCGR_PEP_ID=MMETSP0010_2-20120614/14395_1 /TAXON_ID=216773 ORGANISM="Corethron hystrix, Strain 308" /NCGR_SAMPLE_ID=MMETSP0010_2 /ASSEMBLY_ACC=CAM_ASM_000155 /LENGTH=387 /DNA_ID=CAMNT_0000178517 /DNA_START=212 /DNA_END=1375 /DNA_ORIENTATION=+ /assembly_acc=CAM_ASM_000155
MSFRFRLSRENSGSAHSLNTSRESERASINSDNLSYDRDDTDALLAKVGDQNYSSTEHHLNEGEVLTGQVVSKSNSEKGPMSTKIMVYLFFFLFVILGVFAYSFVFEELSVRDSLYLTIVTVTTVGYGDFCPRDRSSKIFTIFFAILGVFIIGIGLAFAAADIIENHIAGINAAEEMAAKNVLKKFKKGQFEEDQQNLKNMLDVQKEHCGECFTVIIPYLTFLIPGSLLIGHIEGWSCLDTLYWFVITATTIGYGDYAPDMNDSKWVAILLIPFAVAVTTECFGRAATYLANKRLKIKQQDLIQSVINMENFDAIDTDHDGTLSEVEYISFMLIEMNKCDRSLMDELRSQFKEMDLDGSGFILKEELRTIAEEQSAMLDMVEEKLIV